jgi:hypothetical protein
MTAYLEQAMFNLMGYPVIMAIWVALTSMLYLLQVRAHRFRSLGTIRLFVTAAIMGIVVPGVAYVLGLTIDRYLNGSTQRLLVILAGPFLIILAFALVVSLIQHFLGADAETALRWAWPITGITYCLPILIFVIASVFHQKWLIGKDTLY